MVICLQSSGCAQQATLVRPAAQQVAKDYRFAAGQSSLRIPIDEDDGYIFLQLSINDSGPLWFGLDTGATHSLIDRRRAESLGLKSESNRQIAGAGGVEDAAIFQNVAIKLPGVELSNQTLWGLPLDTIASAHGRQMAGILGYDLFKYFVVDIDYSSNVMNLYEPGAYHYRGTGQSIPLNVQGDGEIYVRAKLQAPIGDPIEGEFVIDTGGNRTLLLAQDFVDQHRLTQAVGKTLMVRGGGVGGEIQLAMGRLKSLQLGQFVLTNPVAGFTRVGQIADASKAGNIGGGFLRRFRVIFDYSRKRMILEPNSRLTEPDEFDMSGAALMSEGPDFSVIRVVRVRPDSPAAQAGLEPQDEILAVVGQPEKTLSVNGVKKLFRVEREYKLKVKRKEKILEVTLKLRRLI
ncbi:MAG TPA: aspartyl protease family protein [Pyrinomonadaceae bacterium]